MFAPPPIPPDEARRLIALQQCNVLDTEAEQEFDAIVENAAEIAGVPICLISLVDDDRQWFKARVGLDANETSRELSFCARSILNTAGLTVPDTHEDDRFRDHPLVIGEPRIRFYTGFNLTLDSGEALGTLCVIDVKPNRLTEQQSQRLSVLARQATAMLDLRRKITQLSVIEREQRQTISELRAARAAEQLASVTIFSLARLAESRDYETGMHLERVRCHSQTLARQLRQGAYADQIDDHFIDLLYRTSPLHDIGKVAIPDCVLLKPGRLSDAEFEIMKSHAEAGAETLEAAITLFPEADFLQMAREIALTHHERFDGSGYPRGIAGDRIPLAGRIVALADVYDALTSTRVYKPAASHQVARNMILEESGKHFDPEIVEAFVGCEQAFIETADRFADAQASQAA